MIVGVGWLCPPRLWLLLCAGLLVCAGLLHCAGLPLLVLGMAEVGVLLEVLLLQLLLLLELDVLLPLELELLMGAVISVVCARVTLRNLRGLAFSHCSCFSLFKCSLSAPSEEPTNAPQRDSAWCLRKRQKEKEQPHTT